MRLLLLLLCAVLAWAEAVAPTSGLVDVGAASPGFAGAVWLRGAAPAKGVMCAVVFWASADGYEPAEGQPSPDADLALVAMADTDGDVARHLAAKPGGEIVAAADPALLIRWLGASDAVLPAAALVGADGLLLWRGRTTGLAAAVARERAGGFDRARLAELAGLRSRLRTALDRDHGAEEALVFTGEILKREPVDEDALHLRLDLCRHLGHRESFRETLAALPVDTMPAELANELAWERATDQDVAWRNLDLALKLVGRARAALPDDGTVEDTYARILYLLGMIDDAVAAQIRAVSLLPDDQAAADALDYYREVQGLREERRKRPLPQP